MVINKLKKETRLLYMAGNINEFVWWGVAKNHACMSRSGFPPRTPFFITYQIEK